MKTNPCPLRILVLAGWGCDGYVKVSGTTPISKGQQLTDLQAALAAGAIDQAGFDKRRTIMLKRPG